MGELSRARWTIALAGLLTVACGHRPATSTTGTGPYPVPQDIQQVCTDFVTTAFSVDTTTDHTPADARRRATHAFGLPELDKGFAGAGRDPDWPLLVEHRARVEVSARPVSDDPPPVRGDQAAAGVEISRSAAGRDGWRHALPGAVAYCSLRRTPAGWKVAALTLSDTDTTGDRP